MASRTGRGRRPKSDGLVQDVPQPQSEDQGVQDAPKPAKSKVCWYLVDIFCMANHV